MNEWLDPTLGLLMGRQVKQMAAFDGDVSGAEVPEQIELRGVRTHNLKCVDCAIPRGRLTVFTGPSGSGKSSLAFDTLYAEGQRRYTESLSTYARQFIERLERPPVDHVANIQPALALRQHNDVSNARSTVGTVTEINDHLELLFTHAGEVRCPECDEVVRRDTVATGLEALGRLEEGARLVLVAPVPAPVVEHRPTLFKQLVADGYGRVYLGGEAVDLDGEGVEAAMGLDELPVIIDRIVLKHEGLMRQSEAIEAAFALGKGRVLVFRWKEQAPTIRLDRGFRCNGCDREFTEPQPALFSFNSSLGACPTCTGFGKTIGVDFRKVIPNDRATLEGGALAPLETPSYARVKSRMLEGARERGVPVDLPFRLMSREHQRWVREGDGGKWYGIRGFFERLEQKQYKTSVRVLIARYRGYDLCPTCEGARLSYDAQCVTVAGATLGDLWAMRLEELLVWFRGLDLGGMQRRVAIVVEEIMHRLIFLQQVGLGYLTLDRQSRTLSGGEMQRIHLTASLGRALTDTLYVLDEPTAGLHARDSMRLLRVLKGLRDLGNTVVVVEHDPEIILGADHLVELGPGGGERGGEIVWSGSREAFEAADTLTRHALNRPLDAPRAEVDLARGGALFAEGEAQEWFGVVGAREHNLEEITVRFPCRRLSVVTGVSGSGKSTLMHQCLVNNWKRSRGTGVDAGAIERLEGMDQFEDVVVMSQGAIGRSARSNALTYTKAYDDVRRLLSSTARAAELGLSAGDFSFNTKGGRCERCEGMGSIVVEMHFMPDVEITCPECQGKRFTERVLGARWEGKNIHDILEMTVQEGADFFRDHRGISRKLRPLLDVGLGYIRLGQSTSTLSGGEAQRLKLATYLAEGQKSGGTRPVLLIFDEPTVGLHLKDVEVLLGALRQMTALGHTIVAVEHHQEFIAEADYVVDLGPDAGPRGGQVVATGTPREIAAHPDSVTGACLRELFDRLDRPEQP